MSEPSDTLRYEPQPEVPKEFRRVDWTFIAVHNKPFEEAVAAFQQLKEELHETFADKPFAHLHLLRAIEDRLLACAFDTGQGVATYLEHLHRRVDLEFGRYEVGPKATTAILLARHLAGLGDPKLARSLLTAEQNDLDHLLKVCQECLESVRQASDAIPEE